MRRQELREAEWVSTNHTKEASTALRLSAFADEKVKVYCKACGRLAEKSEDWRRSSLNSTRSFLSASSNGTRSTTRSTLRSTTRSSKPPLHAQREHADDLKGAGVQPEKVNDEDIEHSSDVPIQILQANPQQSEAEGTQKELCTDRVKTEGRSPVCDLAYQLPGNLA